MRHDTAVKATRRAQIQILDAGVLAQGGELEPRGQFLAVTLCGLAVDKDAETLFEGEIVEGGRPALLFKRLGNASRGQGLRGGLGGRRGVRRWKLRQIMGLAM